MLSALMTVYNEIDFLDYAIQSCINEVDHLVIVEGAYKETINLGKPSRSTDGTLEIIEKYKTNPKVHIIFANEQSDKDQRNIGLSKIKELNPNGWLYIHDGDEVYTPQNYIQIKALCKRLDKLNFCKGIYFNSLTFVNDFYHFTNQIFPRLFKITPDCIFKNDNYMTWKNDLRPDHIEAPFIANQIYFHHYSYCKNLERFSTKEKWWKTRFNKEFNYGWHINENGLIEDSNHKIFEYKGKHPEIMKGHPLYEKRKV